MQNEDYKKSSISFKQLHKDSTKSTPTIRECFFIDYSGTDGLRNLLGNTSRAAASVPAQGQAGGNVINVNIAPGAFQGVADPTAHGTQIVQTIQTQMAKTSALDNASRGEGG